MGRRLTHLLLCAPGRGDEALPGLAAHARHAGGRRHARVPGRRRTLRGRRRADQERALCLLQQHEPDHQRGLVHAGRRRHRQPATDRSPAPGRRVLGRPPGRPLRDPDQRRRAQLQADGGAAGRSSARELDGDRPRARRRPAQHHGRARKPRRARPALRRPAAAGGSRLPVRRDPRRRPAGLGLYGLCRLEPGL